MNLSFSDKSYFDEASKVLSNEVNGLCTISNIDSFFVLIHGLKIGDLSNLCDSISNILNISVEEAYLLTQNMDNDAYKELIFNEAIKIILGGNNLGNAMSGKFNTSSWVNHCVYEAILSYNLASLMNLNKEFAFNYGLLHDYGRKYVHDFTHVVRGFEELVNLGIIQEARACLTHSFIHGGRYCNMEVAPEGFYVDDDGREYYGEEDDISKVLKCCDYSDYDNIVNVADLMAMSSGVVSPEERVKDILTRRNNLEQSPNWPYFLGTFCNLLIDILNKMNIQHSFEQINYKEHNIEEIKKLFSDVSSFFYSIYNEKIKNNDYTEQKKR